MSVDPLVVVSGEPYVYAAGSPTVLTDPTGLLAGWDFAKGTMKATGEWVVNVATGVYVTVRSADPDYAAEVMVAESREFKKTARQEGTWNTLVIRYNPIYAILDSGAVGMQAWGRGCYEEAGGGFARAFLDTVLLVGTAGAGGVLTSTARAAGRSKTAKSRQHDSDNSAGMSQAQQNRAAGNAVRNQVAHGYPTLAKEKRYKTSTGRRVVDIVARFPGGLQVVEVKSGRVKMSPQITAPIDKDVEIRLDSQNRVRRSVWHFEPNAKGEQGPVASVQEHLEQKGYKQQGNRWILD